MTNELINTLEKILQWDPRRINFITLLIQALIKVRTVNMAEVAKGFDTPTKTSSTYRRIQNFFLILILVLR